MPLLPTSEGAEGWNKAGSSLEFLHLIHRLLIAISRLRHHHSIRHWQGVKAGGRKELTPIETIASKRHALRLRKGGQGASLDYIGGSLRLLGVYPYHEVSRSTRSGNHESFGYLVLIRSFIIRSSTIHWSLSTSLVVYTFIGVHPQPHLA